MQTRILKKENWSDRRKFKSLPYSLYRENPYWIPPVQGEIDKVMSPLKHPFYAHSEADFIIVESGREVLGRLAVLHNRNYCIYHHRETAFFHYFECVDDSQTATSLFAAAEDWAHQRGLNTIFGARGFLRSNGSGILIDGFEALPAMGIPYNLPYYGQLIESCGYIKANDSYSGVLERHPDPMIHNVAEKVITRGNFHILEFNDMSEFVPWIPKIYDVQDKSYNDSPSICPSTSEEFEMISRSIIALTDPRYIKLIMHNGDIAGFIVAYPDINKSLKQCNGHLFPFGWMAALNEKRHPSVIDIAHIGLLPQYQGLGGNALLYSELNKVLSNTRIRKAEVVQVDEHIFRNRSDIKNLGITISKTHRTYQKSI